MRRGVLLLSCPDPPLDEREERRVPGDRRTEGGEEGGRESCCWGERLLRSCGDNTVSVLGRRLHVLWRNWGSLMTWWQINDACSLAIK